MKQEIHRPLARLPMILVRSTFVTVATSLALSAPLMGFQARAAERLPNVIIIFTDDQGYGDVGVFGAKGFTTPNLDRLAAEGCKFTNFHVPQPVCSASRAGLLTGCYPNRIGIHGALGPAAQHGLADTEMTLAQLVKQKGYATGMAGKWHLGRPTQFLPTHHGFDEYFGLPYSNDMWPLHPEAKPGAYPPLPLIQGDQVIKLGLGHEDQEQLTTQYTQRAVDFIERNKDRPFFFYLAYSMPHVPLHVSRKFKGKSQQGLYGDVIMEIDWSVGEILKTLDQHKLDRDTLIIFTSDNGPWLSYGNHAGSAGPLREGKGTCWEGGTRVPCLMRWPGKIPASSTNDQMLMTIDLFPTIAKLSGAELPKHKIDGLDAWPIISGEQGAQNPHAGYACYYEQNQLQAVTSADGRWKLQLPHTYRTLEGRPGGTNGIPAKYAQRKLESSELFDLTNDIGEAKNVAAAQPEIVKQLEAFAENMRAELGDSLTKRTGQGVREPGYVAASADRKQSAESVVYEGRSGPGVGKHIVFLTGDEEYRSEESLVQMAQILAVRHGFKCTVLFSLDPKDGTINPNASHSLGGAEALDSADAIFMMLRFREWPDATMKHFADTYLAGKPIIALRTSTHAFSYPGNSTSPFRKYSFNSKAWEGGFGRQVLGETWVSHLGKNHQEATRGFIEESERDDPVLRGVGVIFADTGAYVANPQPDSKILVRGQVLAGMSPDSPPEATGKNQPEQPVAWRRIHCNEAGQTNKVFCTTMGSAADVRDENLRRLLVNSVYWGLDLEVPARANVALVGDYQPNRSDPNQFRTGVKPKDLVLPTTTP